MTMLHSLPDLPPRGASARAAALPLPGTLPSGSRLRRVLEAHRVITADLSSAAMVDRLLQAAVSLTGADYGAVVVLSSSGTVTQTILHNGEVAERAGWRAVLQPLDVGDEDSTGSGSGSGSGSASGSAPTASERARALGRGRVLGSTVRARRLPFLELYVGRAGDTELDDDAAQLLDALAELAGTAMENALLHEDAQRSKDWLQASGDIARTLLSDADSDMLRQVALRALQVADADSVGLFLPHGSGLLKVAMSAGIGAQDFNGILIEAEFSALGRAILRGESLLVDDMSEIMRPDYVNVHDFGPVMSAPLMDARGVRGSIVLCRRRGRPAYTAHDLDLATTFADQLALALEMDDARLRGEWVKVLEVRHRIAQDLHDNVMQRLFATGVGLQGLAAGDLPPDVGRRLGRYITDLDETIDEIRTQVFGLRDAAGSQQGPAASRFPHVAPDETAP